MINRVVLCLTSMALFSGLKAGELASSTQLPSKAASMMRVIRVTGTQAIFGENSAGPTLSWLSPGFSPSEERKLEVPGGTAATLLEVAVSEAGDVLTMASARNDSGQGHWFLAFFDRDRRVPPVLVQTYPLVPVAVASAPGGGFVVLFSHADAPADYPAVSIFGRDGKLIRNIVSFNQLGLPKTLKRVGDFHGSRPQVAAAGDRVFLFVPFTNEIQHWSISGERVNTISVRLPDGGEPMGVSRLSASSDLRVALSASGPRGEKRWIRAITTADGKTWTYLRPENEQHELVLGAKGTAFAVGLERDGTLSWLR